MQEQHGPDNAHSEVAQTTEWVDSLLLDLAAMAQRRKMVQRETQGAGIDGEIAAKEDCLPGNMSVQWVQYESALVAQGFAVAVIEVDRLLLYWVALKLGYEKAPNPGGHFEEQEPEPGCSL